MRFLLDTCAFLWMLVDDPRLGQHARSLILDPDSELLLSAASAWEMAIKERLGKLILPQPLATLVPAQLKRNMIEPLAVSHEHALATATLPPYHRDPFDRLLIAQARIERVAILTPDEAFSPYDVSVAW
jgi:PIN domain nuclease of toxin-antitoxin system